MYISRVSFTAVNLWAMIKYDIIQATFIKLFFEAIWPLIRVLILYLEVPHLDPWILFSMTQFQICNVVHFYSFWAETFRQKMKKYQYLHILIYLVFIVLCEFPFFFMMLVDYISQYSSPRNTFIWTQNTYQNSRSKNLS